MRWTIFALFALLAVVLDSSLTQVLTIRSLGWMTPSVTACLVVFISLFGTRSVALWSAWMLGVVSDLLVVSVTEVGVVHMIGPHALGFLVGTAVILQLRSVVFRRRVLTFALLAFVMMVSMTITAAILAIARDLAPWMSGEVIPVPGSHLGVGLAAAAYTAVLAFPLGWLLLASIDLWAFSMVQRRSIQW
jgi:cell shape-determining protein MreD